MANLFNTILSGVSNIKLNTDPFGSPTSASTASGNITADANGIPAYYNPHGTIRIDHSAVDQANELINDCQSFLSLSKSTALNLPFQAFSRIRNWRNKKRDIRLANIYEMLLPRLKDNEKTLRLVISELVEQKNALKHQGKFLMKRLEACIEFNKTHLLATSEPVEECRRHVSNLSSELISLKAMLSFNQELVRLKAASDRTFVPWQSRNAMYRPVNDSDLSKDSDHVEIKSRLDAYRETRESLVSVLTTLLEYREIFSNNLTSAETSWNTLNHLINKLSPPVNNIFAANEQICRDDSEYNFDHSQCSDCQYGIAISNDCLYNINTLNVQSLEANRCLQLLVELREQMNEIAATIDLTQSDLGTENMNDSMYSMYATSSTHENSSGNLNEALESGQIDTVTTSASDDFSLDTDIPHCADISSSEEVSSPGDEYTNQ